MCSEFDILKCHRRFIAADIAKKGIEVMVIDKEGNISKHEPEVSKKMKAQKKDTDCRAQTKLIFFPEG